MKSVKTWSQDERLWSVLVLNIVMVVGLVLVGLLAHSLGVLAAGGDYIADAGAIAISLLALSMSRHPHGHPHAKNYAAMVNVLFMLIVTALIIYGSIHRLTTHATPIVGLPVFVMSSVGAIAMVFSAYILTAGKDNDLNMRAVLLDTIADAAFGASVAVVGLIIFFTNHYYFLDPLVALFIALIIFYHALVLFKDIIKDLRKIQT